METEIEKNLKEARKKIDFLMKLANTNRDVLAKAMIEFTTQYLRKKYERKTRKDQPKNFKSRKKRNSI